MGRKKTGAALSLLMLSVMLSACEAVTAQNIPSTTSSSFNAGGAGGRGAQMGMPGNFDGGGFGGRGGGSMRQALDADLTGRIASIDGNTVTLELLEQGTGAADAQTEWTATGEETTLELSGVEVSYGADTQSGARQGGQSDGTTGDGSNEAESDSSAEGSELEEGQIVMVWYREGTETPERIRILE